MISGQVIMAERLASKFDLLGEAVTPILHGWRRFVAVT